VLALLALLMMAAACSSIGDGNGDGAGGAGGGAGYARVRVLAPIESVEVVVAESDPPQYFVHIVSGLPSGCASFEEVEVDRSGGDVAIAVWNLVPAPTEPVACTAVYGYQEHNVPLGADFTSGEVYRVVVNGVEEIFAAQ
jgi:hypothetical protein